MNTYAYGFPKLGKAREFKRLIEDYWIGKLSEKELFRGLEDLEENRIRIYASLVDEFPSGEMTLYDHMLDAALLFGVYKVKDLKEYFDLCRGPRALQMKKWFNTNYHYLVSDFEGKVPEFFYQKPIFKPLKNLKNVYLIAPFTFLKLSKNLKKEYFEGALIDLVKILMEYALQADFESLHLDDPALVLDLEYQEIEALKKAYGLFESIDAQINLFTYYDSVDTPEVLFDLPVAGLGFDMVHDRGENVQRLKNIRPSKKLFAGVVDGRNVWKTDIVRTKSFLDSLSEIFSEVIATNAAPLFHLPFSLEGSGLDRELTQRIAFAEERLRELSWLKNNDRKDPSESECVVESRKTQAEKEDVVRIKPSEFLRTPSFSKRREIQQERFNLPLLPTTTIGSFPQTKEVRKMRLMHKNGHISDKEYEAFIKGEIAKCIKIQEELGLDVLVHGEFERSDMVEFFAQKLEGIATTNNGWIISYGTRCYRPPIIYGRIKRTKPMTLKEITFAQKLTNKPVKGMLTGPVTIMAWSYVREDIPEANVAYEIALALREEIKDYEKKLIGIVQIDEPAFKEKAPLKKRNRNRYFEWAVKAFKLCHSGAKPETQIHTHMCYSDFSDIMEYIVQLDFDVISIEASRSKGDIVEAFENVLFDREIGLGVWDIHSPCVPEKEAMRSIVERALKVIPPDRFWINPDCGLKTRNYSEVIPSLKAMIDFAREMRRELQQDQTS